MPFPGVTERDSRKDQAVVIIFIVATAGLLTWAAVKPWVGGWIDVGCQLFLFLSSVTFLHFPFHFKTYLLP